LKGVLSSNTSNEPTQREDVKRPLRRAIAELIIKAVNFSHLFSTRYALQLENLKGAVSSDTFCEPTQRADSKKTINLKDSDNHTLHQRRQPFTSIPYTIHIPYFQHTHPFSTTYTSIPSRCDVEMET
jgi:hypothetical protein